MNNELRIMPINNLKKVIILGLIVVVIGLVLVNFRKDKEKDDKWQPSEAQLAEVTPEKDRIYREIMVGDKKLKVEVVDTAKKITTGLSYRSEIGSDGMLFVMPSRGVPSFWMKGMRFPLDLVWVDCDQDFKDQISNLKNNECIVVDISDDVPVEVDPNHPKNFYSPKAPVTHVLEVESNLWNFNKEDKVMF